MEENITAVCTLLTADPRLTVCAIADELNTSKDTVSTIIHHDMGCRKICVRFVPHVLTAEQKQYRLACSHDLVDTTNHDPNFLTSIVTGDESWCFLYDQQTIRQSAAWLSPQAQRPQKVRQQKSKWRQCWLLSSTQKAHKPWIYSIWPDSKCYILFKCFEMTRSPYP